MPKLILEPGHWYGWQMVPGYEGSRNVPYFSPIYVSSVQPAATGRRALKLKMLNALYADGVQNFSIDLRILKHAPDYLVAEIDENDASGRIAIVSHLEFEWLRRFCPALWESSPPESFGPVEQGSVTQYLNALYAPSN